MATTNQKFSVTIVDMSLGGAYAMCAAHIPVGTRADLTLKSGAVSVEAVVLIRGLRKGGINFEIVDMAFEERSKLRRLLLDIQKESA
ncbi:MAG: PilZ domain-containing protein [Acidobacteria bacterium]|nr:PilZ domain-containing protein [Acidobacteriota bacterium]